MYDRIKRWTPGPWSVNCRQITADESEESRGGLIATCRPSPLRRPEANANSRLIASAPDLVEAIERISCNISMSPNAPNFSFFLTLTMADVNFIDDALKRAYGQVE